MTVCLAMIVKNEAHVLERCLRSVRPFIDAWVIVDTGSTDGTEMIPRRVLEGIPGEVVHRTWKDFATNRNESLELAWEKADYALVVDADDVLEGSAVLPDLAADIVHLRVVAEGRLYWRPHLVKRASGKYVGKMHEGFVGNEGASRQELESPRYLIVGGGARSIDPDKWLKDAQALQGMLDENPDDTRAAFYLAQCLEKAGRVGMARSAYGRRVAMARVGGDEEEVWYSLFSLGRLAVEIGETPAVIIDSFLWAYELRPGRAEPLRALSDYLRHVGRTRLAETFDRLADEIPLPDGECLFLDPAAYVKSG